MQKPVLVSTCSVEVLCFVLHLHLRLLAKVHTVADPVAMLVGSLSALYLSATHVTLAGRQHMLPCHVIPASSVWMFDAQKSTLCIVNLQQAMSGAFNRLLGRHMRTVFVQT